jgi:hypothetical protein
MDTQLTAHVAGSIERVGGEADDYGGAAEMAAQMLARFPAVRYVAVEYVRGNEDRETLDYTVCEALAEF